MKYSEKDRKSYALNKIAYNVQKLLSMGINTNEILSFVSKLLTTSQKEKSAK